jgi:hypothetical protein
MSWWKRHDDVSCHYWHEGLDAQIKHCRSLLERNRDPEAVSFGNQ